MHSGDFLDETYIGWLALPVEGAMLDAPMSR